MFTPYKDDDVQGILLCYNPQARVGNSALIAETWIDKSVPIPTQEQYDEAREIYIDARTSKLLPYQEQRKLAYQMKGLSAEAWALALVQKEIDGDSAEWNRLSALRAEIKVLIPKPV